MQLNEYATFEVLPGLARALPRVSLGSWPTPVEPLRVGRRVAASDQVWVKREDVSAQAYGGNKVRPLEVVFGECLDRGMTRIWATGALGSNHSVATSAHAPTAGLDHGAILWGQPTSECARENLRATVSLGAEIRALRSVVALPFSAAWLAAMARLLGRRDYLMAPGAATPLGALGHISAGLELARQVDAGELPAPRHIVLPVGSTCTTAGMLVAMQLARQLGLGWRVPPFIWAVRVTPWPVTEPRRIARLAVKAAAELARRGGPRVDLDGAGYRRHFSVLGSYLGPGYGRPTAAGIDAIHRFRAAGAPVLDTTYSAKAAAFLFDMLPRASGSVLLWATKSSAPLPPDDAQRLSGLPRWLRRWLEVEDDSPATFRVAA